MALISIIDYDMGNLRNVERALIYAGAEVRIVRSPSEAADAAGVVLPGVGNFHDAMKNLDRAGLSDSCATGRRRTSRFSGFAWGFRCCSNPARKRPACPVSGF